MELDDGAAQYKASTTESPESYFVHCVAFSELTYALFLDDDRTAWKSEWVKDSVAPDHAIFQFPMPQPLLRVFQGFQDDLE